jgi:hypothetical protein
MIVDILKYGLAVAALISSSVNRGNAEEVVLKCRSLDGQIGPTITVDVEGKAVRWGDLKLIITKVDDNFLTARTTDATYDVGGEIWVLDRATGTLLRATAGRTCRDPALKDCALYTHTYRSICQKRVL